MGLYVGLMSGTSVDTVDAVLVEFTDASSTRILATHRAAIPTAIRKHVLRSFRNEPIRPLVLGELDVTLGRMFAAAVLRLLRASKVDQSAVSAIGSHGQTIHHAPGARRPFTLQLGDPNIIAEHTGITTVGDFRRRDVAAGGEGAPLVPAFHAYALRSVSEARCVLNLGGIANISILPRYDDETPVTGLDTGPANALLDVWAQERIGKPMDTDGDWARTGVVHEPLLACLLSDPYFDRPPPKSTGREHFSLAWLTAAIEQCGTTIADNDVARTICELTAASVADAITRWSASTGWRA